MGQWSARALAPRLPRPECSEGVRAHCRVPPAAHTNVRGTAPSGVYVLGIALWSLLPVARRATALDPGPGPRRGSVSLLPETRDRYC